MTTFTSSTATQPSTPTEMEALVFHWSRVCPPPRWMFQIPAVVALEAAAARASATAAGDAAAAAAAAQASPVWVRGIPKTPAELELQYPEGSGETWKEANDNCDGVPNQLKQKKTSRLEALACDWGTEVDAGRVVLLHVLRASNDF
ncbi:hypothetical protein B0H14DRAFT_2654183 [Mycena olivaceomarginata]|nr:hypothetical protein B0H14DRAFT_2654183 [Mycena olivaceomarginata]